MAVTRWFPNSNNQLHPQVKILEENLRTADTLLHERDTTIHDMSDRITRLEEQLNDTEQALQEKSEMSKSEISDLTEKNKLLIDQKLKLHEELQVVNDDLEHS